MKCHLPKVHHRISCYLAQHTHGSYRYSVLQTHPAGDTVGNSVVHFVDDTVDHLQSSLSWAQMEEHLVECHEKVSSLFAVWRTGKRKEEILMYYMMYIASSARRQDESNSGL